MLTVFAVKLYFLKRKLVGYCNEAKYYKILVFHTFSEKQIPHKCKNTLNHSQAQWRKGDDLGLCRI